MSSTDLGGGGEVPSDNGKLIDDAVEKSLKRSYSSAFRDSGLNEDEEDSVCALPVPSDANGHNENRHRSSSSFTQRKLSGEDSETDSDGVNSSWVSWFCNTSGNEFFCKVPDEYIQDYLNLCGLRSKVPHYHSALSLILGDFSHGDIPDKELEEEIESAAEMLYGLIHARYILTGRGMMLMLAKYERHDFGICPRIICNDQPCLPIGRTDIPGTIMVQIYCPKCEEIYYPGPRYECTIDGAYFGTTFPHLFLMTFGHLKPQKSSQGYVPRVFGFKIHKA